MHMMMHDVRELLNFRKRRTHDHVGPTHTTGMQYRSSRDRRKDTGDSGHTVRLGDIP